MNTFPFCNVWTLGPAALLLIPHGASSQTAPSQEQRVEAHRTPAMLRK